MSDLIVTSFTPVLGSGMGLRTYGVIAALAREGPVEVAYVPFGADRPAAAYGDLGNVTMRRLEAGRGARRAAAYALARMRGVPDDLARGCSWELAHAADDASGADRVIADGPVVAGALLGLARRRALIYLAHNLESGFRGEGPGLARFERGVLRTFSESWMATRSDQQGAAELAGWAVPTRYVPNVVDVQKIVPVRPAGTGCVLFVGDFTYAPNREALAFLVDQVLPEAWKTHPSLRLLVVGRGLTDPPGDERIEVLGFVDELRSAYERADVVAVPLLHGGGSPLKFVEALAYGLPVVATSHAAALLEDGTGGTDFLVAADRLKFAGALTTMLGEPARALELGAAGRELAARSYSIDALATLLNK